MFHLFCRASFPAVAALMLLCSCAAGHSTKQLSTEDKERVVQRLIDNRDFTGIFEKAYEVGTLHQDGGGNYLVSDAVMAYVRTCCTNREDAIALLKANGFKVYTGGVYDPQSKGPYQETTPYDERIFAERLTPIIRLYAWKTYRVNLYLEQGQVVRVLAHAFPDAL